MSVRTETLDELFSQYRRRWMLYRMDRCLGYGIVGMFLLIALLPEKVGAQAIVVESVPTLMPTVQVQTNSQVHSSAVVCPRCGVSHGASHSPVEIVSAGRVLPANGGQSVRNVGGASNVLGMLNSQRARQGLAALQYDARLQAVAVRRAQWMASNRSKNHPPGSFAPGTYEGVGWSSSHSPQGVSACFTSDPRMRAAGAAMVTGSDGVYFCVVYR